MNATNAKALNSMKQKVKKTQRDHEAVFAKYKEVCGTPHSQLVPVHFANVLVFN